MAFTSSTRRTGLLRTSVLVIIALLRGSLPSLGQDINGGADLAKDISGGAVGVLTIPRVNKQHNKRVPVPSQFQATARPSEGSRRGSEKPKPRPTPPRPRPPRPTPTADDFNDQGEELA